MTGFVVLHQILTYITTIYIRNLKKSKIKAANFPTTILLYSRLDQK